MLPELRSVRIVLLLQVLAFAAAQGEWKAFVLFSFFRYSLFIISTKLAKGGVDSPLHWSPPLQSGWPVLLQVPVHKANGKLLVLFLILQVLTLKSGQS